MLITLFPEHGGLWSFGFICKQKRLRIDFAEVMAHKITLSQKQAQFIKNGWERKMLQLCYVTYNFDKVLHHVEKTVISGNIPAIYFVYPEKFEIPHARPR